MTAVEPSRDADATRPCPVCQVPFAPWGHRRYCSAACRATAWRRRHQPTAPVVVVPAGRPRRPLTVYECEACRTRAVGNQHCEGCGSFMRRVGLGGCCPYCEEPVSVTDLFDEEVMADVVT